MLVKVRLRKRSEIEAETLATSTTTHKGVKVNREVSAGAQIQWNLNHRRARLCKVGSRQLQHPVSYTRLRAKDAAERLEGDAAECLVGEEYRPCESDERCC